MGTQQAIEVLHVEDDVVEQEAVLRALTEPEFRVTTVGTLAEMRGSLQKAAYDVLLLDYHLPDGHSLKAVTNLAVPPFILVTGQGTEDVAVEAMHTGAQDYVMKDSSSNYTKVLSATIRGVLEQRASATELQQRTEEVTEFARVAAHELREPLRTLAASIDFLELRHLAGAPPAAKEALTAIRERARRALSIVDDLRGYAELSSLEHDATTVCLDEVLRDVTTDLQAAIEEKGAEVRVDPLPAIDGNPVQLRRVFLNLIGNALKFSREDAKPVVEVSCQSPRRGELEVTVKDNGIGFAPRHARKIFQVFKRLHHRDRYDGNGLGLTICKRIVEKHGGTIVAESELGQGATFRLLLPQ